VIEKFWQALTCFWLCQSTWLGFRLGRNCALCRFGHGRL